MSNEQEPTGIEQARAARKRAEDEYEKSVAGRPETIAEVARAITLRNQNQFAETLILAMQSIRRPAS